MPIRPPALDDRSFDDLVKELISRIPAHTPEWTNPRTGDPGRTLIDLFAWLGDALLYRANLIPERQRLVFLRLLGQPLRPCRPARGIVTVSPKQGKTAVACKIQPGAVFSSGSVSFEAADEFTVLPVAAAILYKKKVQITEIDPAVTQALSNVQNNGAPVNPYLTTELFVAKQQGEAAHDIFGESQDRSLWFALLAPKAAAVNDQNALNASVLNILSGDEQGQRMVLNIGFVPGLPPVSQTDHSYTASGIYALKKFNFVPAADLPGTGSSRANVPHIWEAAIKADGEIIDENRLWQPRYLTLDEISDGTQGLTRPGIIRLALPRGHRLFAPSNNLREDITAGVGDRPPRVDDKNMARQLIGWLRLRPRLPQKSLASEQKFTPGASEKIEIPLIPSISNTSEVEHCWVSWMGINAVAIEQLLTKRNIIIGESNGTADQTFSLPARSVEPETFQILVEEDSGWVVWTRVDDLSTLDYDADSARDSRAYQLDSEAGTISFGDGVRGRIPGNGRRILVGQMRFTSGAAGNLPANSGFTVSAKTINNEEIGSSVLVTQPLNFAGGADSETLAEAEKRIPLLFKHKDRAVTAEDYQSIAKDTPGVAVARVEILPRFKPQQRMFNVPGVISVMVLPQAPYGPAPNPRADRPFLEAVHAWLDARRPLGTELYVIGCEYVPVALSVAVSIADGAPVDTTLQAVKNKLTQVLWPLSGGGFDGLGWRLNRSLSNRELAVEVARVPGVSEVNGLNLFKRQQNGKKRSWRLLGDARNGKEQNIKLNEWQLPELLGVAAVDANDAPVNIDPVFGLGDDNHGLNPFADSNAVAVPVAASALQCTCGKQL